MPPSSSSGPPTAERPPFLRSAITTYGTTVAVSLLSLVNVLVMARALGPTGRGEVVFLLTIATLTSQLSLLGLGQANVNLAGARPRRTPALATNSVLLALVLGMLGAGAVVAILELFPGAGGDVSPALRWLALASVPILILNTAFTHLVMAHWGFRVVNTMWLFPYVVNLAVNTVCALLGVLTVGIALAGWITGLALATVYLAQHLATRLGGFGRPDLALLREVLGFGARAHTGQVLLIGNYRLDQWLIGSMVGSRELGLYSIAVAWAEGLFMLPAAVAQVQRPDVVRADARAAARQALGVLRMVLVITALLTVAVVAAAPLLCTVVFGEGFRGSVDDLRVLALGAFGVAVLKVLGGTLTAQRRPLLESAAVGTAFICVLALDVILIPAYGGLGAALASAVAYSVGGIVMLLVFSRALGASAMDAVPTGRELGALVARVRSARASGTRDPGAEPPAPPHARPDEPPGDPPAGSM